MIDSEAIKSRYNCQEVISAELGEPLSTSGGAWQWYCVFHDDRSGDSPSLTAWEDGWKCFGGGCNAHGDVITWVMKRQNVDFRRACEILADGRLDSFSIDAPPARKVVPLKQPAGVSWQESAKRFILQAQETLWLPAGATALRYLRVDRGLTDRAIREWGLGYNATEKYDSLDNWPEAKKGTRKKVWLPRAIVIPHWQKSLDIVWSIKFRMPAVSKDDPRYINVPGGQYDLFGVDFMRQREHAILCEGEFDTILLWGIVGDLVDVFTFGSANVRDVSEWMPHLFSIRTLHVALDSDPNGAGEEAAEEWLALTKCAHRALPPGGHKDITDSWRAGEDLRAWVRGLIGIGANLEPDYVTMALPEDSLLPVVPGKWRRMDSGEIEATYTKRELEWAMWCLKGTEGGNDD